MESAIPATAKKLAERVKRGHDGIAREGLVAGSLSYGYDLVKHEPGKRVINPVEGKIVVRIFTEYVNGRSPRQIADGLSLDKIPSPSGAERWNFQSIVGGERKRGLIHNRLYVGEYVKNRFTNIKNPETGKVITRKADDDDLITTKVPHLRIVEQELWDAAHALRKSRGNKIHAVSGQSERAVVPRKLHLLSGLLRCGECNGQMSVTASSRIGQRVGCSASYNSRSCKHSKSYDLGKLTKLAVDSMCSHLVDPEFLKEKAREKTLEFARLEKENNGARQAAVRQFDRLNIQIAKLVRMLDDEDDMPRELLASLKAKEIERRGLEERIRLLGAESNVTTLHPNVIEAFGKNIETLYEKLKRNPDDPECRMAFGNIIDSIIVHPTGNAKPYDISLFARLSAVMGEFNLFPTPRSNEEIVEAEGIPRISTGRTVSSRRPSSRRFIGW